MSYLGGGGRGGEEQTAEELIDSYNLSTGNPVVPALLQIDMTGSPCRASAHPPGGTARGWYLLKVLSSRVLGFTLVLNCPHL